MKKISRKNFIGITAVALVAIIVFIGSGIYFTTINIRNAKAKTVVGSWTFEDNRLHLVYNVKEFSDDSFEIKENYFGSIRIITGRAYLDTRDGRKWAMAVVDNTTQNYWNYVMNVRTNKQHVESWVTLVDIAELLIFPQEKIPEYIEQIASSALNAALEANENSYTATDADKVTYEMACASEAAWHLVNNPNVIVPSIRKPNT